MSGVEWTDAERGCCFGTCGGDVRQHAPHEDQGCAMFEDMLRYLAPHAAAREAQAAAKALREAAEECDSTGHHWSGRPALAFFAVATDLRDRAYRIERGES